MAFWNRKKETETTGNRNQINWSFLDSVSDLETIKEKSAAKTQVIFKHSTRCSISSMAKRRLERTWNIDEGKATIHYLDLIANRSISNQIASDFGVTHQSPQILIIKNGQAIFNTSHNDIDVETIEEWL